MSGCASGELVRHEMTGLTITMRFIVEIIYTICQSDLIKTRAALEQVSRLDASILLSFANPFQVELDVATVKSSDDTLPGFGLDQQ